MKPVARLLVIASAVALVVGPVTETASASSSTPVYKQSDSGSSISPAYGSKFKIRLKVCEDCGDYWRFAQRPDSSIVKLVHKTDISSATPPAVGGINTVTWTYKVVGYGSTTLKLVKRSASQHQKVIKRFKLGIVVSNLPRSG